jgi:glutamate-5-semialdehyde dehydrogenase
MIYESRPNVALEAFSLAFKAGNSIILRGGKEAQQTTAEIYRLIREALDQTGAPLDSLLGVTDPDRRIVEELLQQSKWIDVVVPRGGEKLIEFVVEHSKIPIIKNDRGLCHVYVHSDAQLEMALKIVENAKVQRPGVCNSVETLLVHQKISRQFLPLLAHQLSRFGVEWFGCPKTSAILKGLAPLRSARVENFDTEYLDLKINCKVVSTQDQAIAHIDRHGSRHSECIVTASRKVAQEFMDRVDAAAVYWNASTRFTDGFELGLGGELGISTQKLHVRGPVGLKELTSPRWMIEGTGQVRKS